MYVYVMYPEIRRQRMVSSFLFRNDYSVIGKDAVFASYHRKGISFRERVKEKVAQQILTVLMEPRVREQGTGMYPSYPPFYHSPSSFYITIPCRVCIRAGETSGNPKGSCNSTNRYFG